MVQLNWTPLAEGLKDEDSCKRAVDVVRNCVGVKAGNLAWVDLRFVKENGIESNSGGGGTVCYDEMLFEYRDVLGPYLRNDYYETYELKLFRKKLFAKKICFF
ncbi:hypothetical protein WA026_021844 [Henosepilachna vigintioctopunctata]|uniref:Uncharacterized protein n=1 Tax=Henosepilachna vigintioctopunctata TaxID=420089 RepID=A0AAW1UR97_9CUCU